MTISQLIGSNSGFLALSCLLLSLIFSEFKHDTGYFKNRIKLFSGTIFILLIGVSIYFMNSPENYTNYILLTERLRIFGYGDGVLENMRARFSILANTSIQLDYSPIVGSFLTDEKTVGAGNYPHSSVLSFLTHYGLILGSILLLPVLWTLSNIIVYHSKISDNNTMSYLILDAFFVLVLLSVIGTHFAWPPLVFIIVLSAAFIVKRKNA